MFVVILLFWSTSIAHVCRCDLFGHAQIFRSHSFGYVHSVKRLFLLIPLHKKKFGTPFVELGSQVGDGGVWHHDQIQNKLVWYREVFRMTLQVSLSCVLTFRWQDLVSPEPCVV